jgi:hypothetical protein
MLMERGKKIIQSDFNFNSKENTMKLLRQIYGNSILALIHSKKLLVFFLIISIGGCNYFTPPDRGTSPYLKSLLSIIGLDRTATTVVSVLPKDKSTGNYLNTNVFIVFNKSISGFNTSNFTISSDGGTTPHPGRVEISDKVLIFYPTSNFVANATYTVTVKAASGLSSDAKYTFNTGTVADNTPPSIASTNPAAGDTNMPINITVSATLSELIDPSTVNSSSLAVSGVSGTVSITDQTLAFKSSSNLPANTTFTVTIKSGLKDLAGNTMAAPYSWTFTTGSSVASSCVYDISIFDTCLYE